MRQMRGHHRPDVRRQAGAAAGSARKTVQRAGRHAQVKSPAERVSARLERGRLAAEAAIQGTWPDMGAKGAAEMKRPQWRMGWLTRMGVGWRDGEMVRGEDDPPMSIEVARAAAVAIYHIAQLISGAAPPEDMVCADERNGGRKISGVH
jgi:hypothetical protein